MQPKSKTPWIVCGVIAVVGLCVLVAGGGFALLALRGNSAQGLAVEVELPYHTPVGEQFEMTVTLKNEGEKAFTVNTITLPAELLSLAEVTSVDPPGEDQGDGKYQVDIEVQPGDSQVVTFTLAATAEGSLSGEVEVAAGRTTVKVDVASIGAEVNAQPTEAPEPTAEPTAEPTTEPTAEPTAEPTTEPTQALASIDEIAGIPYKADDFSSPGSGWKELEGEDSAVGYANGEYQMEVKTPNWLMWSHLGDSYDNVILSVDARVVSSTGAGEYGLICRFVDENNFYGFEVSESGYFTIWKELEGEYVSLYDWEASDAILQNEGMTIHAACVDNHLLIGVNGKVLADVIDDSFSTGKVGLLAGTRDQGGLKVAFDNFVVQKPQ